MIDTDYNEESFFVRHAYFLGANDPYKALKTTLKAEIDEEAWASLNSDVSRPFPKPASGRIAVKVINHLGDEVIKVFLAERAAVHLDIGRNPRASLWRKDGSVCPTCGGVGRKSTRYPAALCEVCQAAVSDSSGKSVQLFNEGFSGGLQIVTHAHTLVGSDAENLPLFVNGIECRAREHRFGGVVVQPIDAWKAGKD